MVRLHSPSKGSQLNRIASISQLGKRDCFLLVLGSMTVALIGYLFVHRTLGFALHSYVAKPGNVVEEVLLTERGRTPCKNVALLENSTWVLKRRVCNVFNEGLLSLRGGGQIRLSGTISRYGVHLERYAITETHRPGVNLQSLPK